MWRRGSVWRRGYTTIPSTSTLRYRHHVERPGDPDSMSGTSFWSWYALTGLNPEISILNVNFWLLFVNILHPLSMCIILRFSASCVAWYSLNRLIVLDFSSSVSGQCIYWAVTSYIVYMFQLFICSLAFKKQVHCTVFRLSICSLAFTEQIFWVVFQLFICSWRSALSSCCVSALHL